MKINKNIIGWITYDFANSSFVTIIITVIYSTYFKNVVVGENEYGTALWGRAISISMLLVAISSPIFGAIADYSRSKKKFLFIYCYLTVIFTFLLFFVKEKNILSGMIYLIIANFSFNSGNVFYNAFLPEISNKNNIGKISGFGWAFGYVGGLIALLISLFLIKINVRLVFPMVAVFFGLFALVTFYLLKEVKKTSQRTNYLKVAYKRIYSSITNITKLKDLMIYLLSYFIYNEGIIAVISFAAIYGSTKFNMNYKQLILYFIYAQLTSILGAYFSGYLTDKFGGKKIISFTLFIWIIVVVATLFCQNISQYYYIGLLAGLAIGSSQASSRTMLAIFTPQNKYAEFFGFYASTGKLSAIISPLVYGEIAKRTGSQNLSILSILIFFILGYIILQFVHEKRGRISANNFKNII